jgi:putative SOS response-associated peptidase YedK
MGVVMARVPFFSPRYNIAPTQLAPVISNLTAPTISFLRQLRCQREVQVAEIHFKLRLGRMTTLMTSRLQLIIRGRTPAWFCRP